MTDDKELANKPLAGLLRIIPRAYYGYPVRHCLAAPVYPFSIRSEIVKKYLEIDRIIQFENSFIFKSSFTCTRPMTIGRVSLLSRDGKVLKITNLDVTDTHVGDTFNLTQTLTVVDRKSDFGFKELLNVLHKLVSPCSAREEVASYSCLS